MSKPPPNHPPHSSVSCLGQGKLRRQPTWCVSAAWWPSGKLLPPRAMRRICAWASKGSTCSTSSFHTRRTRMETDGRHRSKFQFDNQALYGAPFCMRTSMVCSGSSTVKARTAGKPFRVGAAYSRRAKSRRRRLSVIWTPSCGCQGEI